MTPTLDGPVLAVLARAGKPLTAGEVAAQTPRGSEIGVRKCLARLVEQGIVRATEMGRNRVHELNREHLGAPIAGLLAGLRLELWNRFRKTLGTWNPKPVYGCVFGSAARGDGDAQSDIDLLLVHPPPPGENDPRRRPRALEAVAGLTAEFTTVQLTERQLAKWAQVDLLRGLGARSIYCAGLSAGGLATPSRFLKCPLPSGLTSSGARALCSWRSAATLSKSSVALPKVGRSSRTATQQRARHADMHRRRLGGAAFPVAMPAAPTALPVLPVYTSRMDHGREPHRRRRLRRPGRYWRRPVAGQLPQAQT